MAAFLDNCRFVPTSGGTSDWTYSSTVGGCQSPSLAGAVNGTKYKFLAISADLTQWEIAEGAYNSSASVFPRTTVLYNSSGTGTTTGQSGAGTKINFSSAPNVAVIGIKEDLISVEEANSFTVAQQTQARSNIGAATSPASWTRTVLTSGSGAYNRKNGCTAINVRLIGGGGGGGGTGTTTTGGSGGTGAPTTFGSLTGGGGSGGSGTGGSTGGSGGAASGGDINLHGATGGGCNGASSVNLPGGTGASGPLGGAGMSPAMANPGIAAQPNTGSGGSGGAITASPSTGGGCGGGSGGYVEALIVSPVASYSYSVGAGGSAGTAGTSGLQGGAGGSGIIIIDEYY